MSKNEQSLPTFEELKEYIKTLPLYRVYKMSLLKTDNSSKLFELLVLMELSTNEQFNKFFLPVAIKICSALLESSLKAELESEES